MEATAAAIRRSRLIDENCPESDTKDGQMIWHSSPPSMERGGPHNQAEPATGIGFSGEYSSLAFDSTGKMAYAHYNDKGGFSPGGLRYIKDTDGDGLVTDETSVAITNTFQDQGYYATLAFDPQDRPMIAHYNNDTADLEFAVLDTGLGWVNTIVDSTNLTGSYLSMAIDPDNGYPAISYYDAYSRRFCATPRGMVRAGTGQPSTASGALACTRR